MSSKDRFARQDRPPAVRRVICIRKVTGGTRITGVVLNEHIWGFKTHWDGNRTRPCFDGKKLCDGCIRQLPSRWKGFLHLWHGPKSEQGYVELTPLAAEVFLETLEGGTMRGLKVMVFRERMDKRSPLKVEILGPYEEVEVLPKAVDPIATLKRIWGLDN